MPLIAAKLGEEASYQLQSALFARTLEEGSRVPAERWLVPTGRSAVEDTLLGWTVFPPAPGDVASRVAEGFRAAFDTGGRSVVAIDMECPAVSSALLEYAFSTLEGGAPLVIGPSDRGGYYLLGMARLLPRLFERVPFGTSGLFRTTLDRALEVGISPVLLPRLGNVEDVPDWEAAAVQGWLPPVPKRTPRRTPEPPEGAKGPGHA
jgi:uncharacterized protein